ncbi:MAG: serine/threonine-protein kinase [Ktedonobacterales bacterium]
METPTRCVRCGRTVPADALFCPGCGHDLRNKRPRLATGLLPANQHLHNQRYVVTHKLAQGGQSAVYLVSDLLDGGAKRAVKEMSESNIAPTDREKAVNDFFREAKMLRDLDHPALAKVYETFVEGQRYFLVMEYVEGHNLEDELIGVGRPLEWERVVDWGMALCDVLAFLHGQSPPIIYRDLKPANVMLAKDGTLKLVDFGIARWLHPERTRDTAQLGTDGYAPLEQYSARSEPRSDLYALGASLYHLLTGRVPESAPSRIAGQPLTLIREVNPRVTEQVEHVVHRSLNLQARDRYDNAAHMRAALEWARNPEKARSGKLRATPSPGPLSGRLGTSGPTPGVSVSRTGGHAMPPRLYVWPLRVDAGYVEANDVTTIRLEIANRGGGRLSGITQTNMRCLSAQPDRIEPGVGALQLRLDTTGLTEGPYTCHLAIRTTGGDQIIPVRFVVRPALDYGEVARHNTGY